MEVNYSFAMIQAIHSLTECKNRELNFMILQELHNTGSISRPEYEKELRALANQI